MEATPDLGTIENGTLHSSASLGSSASLSSSASGTVHIRSSLSSSSSQRRLRASSSIRRTLALSPTKEASCHSSTNVKAGLFLQPSSPCSDSLLPAPNLVEAHRPRASALRRGKCMRWTFFSYCVFCAFYFTCSLFYCSKYFYQRLSPSTGPLLSPLNELSMESKLSRINSMRPVPLSFTPHALKADGVHDDSDITACLWSDERDLPWISEWSDFWKGPISLLVITSTVPSSPPHQLLLARLKALHATRALKAQLSVHVLHTRLRSHGFPNTFLNIARLFSPTRSIVLFPATLSSTPSKGLYEHIQSQMKSDISHQTMSPVILSQSNITSASRFPFSPLPPLLLDQNHPIWCTERFFSAPSRSADWEECLWQFWLTSFGSLHISTNPGWKSLGLEPLLSSADPLPLNVRIHGRLSTRFRHETCILAAKHLRDLSNPVDTLSLTRSKLSDVDRRAIQWLRRTCKQASAWN